MKYKLKNITVNEGDIVDIPLDHILYVEPVMYKTHSLFINYFEEVK